MSQVELTPRAEKSVLDLLGSNEHADETLLFVEMSKGDVRLLLKAHSDFISLQKDLEVVGPFHVPVGEHEMSMFVRDNLVLDQDQSSGSDSTNASDPLSNRLSEGVSESGLYELDFLAVGGKNTYKIRTRSPIKQNGHR